MEVKAHKEFFTSLKRMLNPNIFQRIETFYRNVKRSLWALRKYFKIVTKMNPWDYGSVLEMMKFQMEILSDYIETKGLEVDEHRLPKVEKMKRFIELADNHIKDDFADRCGYDYDYNMNWITLEDDDNNLSELKTTETNTQKTNNSKAIKASHKLDEKEWKEMIELLKDMRTWWD